MQTFSYTVDLKKLRKLTSLIHQHPLKVPAKILGSSISVSCDHSAL